MHWGVPAGISRAAGVFHARGISQIPAGIYSDMPRDTRRDIFVDTKVILRYRAVILYSPCKLSAGQYHPPQADITAAGNITRRKANITEKALAIASAFSWLPLLGLDGVCAAAANELAFGGCAPPISRCETGKLFRAQRYEKQRRRPSEPDGLFLWLPLLGSNQRHRD